MRCGRHTSALLAQIGEFSCVLAVVGYRAEIISDYGYQLTVAIIAATLLLSSIWIALARRVARPPRASAPDEALPF